MTMRTSREEPRRTARSCSGGESINQNSCFPERIVQRRFFFLSTMLSRKRPPRQRMFLQKLQNNIDNLPSAASDNPNPRPTVFRGDGDTDVEPPPKSDATDFFLFKDFRDCVDCDPVDSIEPSLFKETEEEDVNPVPSMEVARRSAGKESPSPSFGADAEVMDVTEALGSIMLSEDSLESSSRSEEENEESKDHASSSVSWVGGMDGELCPRRFPGWEEWKENCVLVGFLGGRNGRRIASSCWFPRNEGGMEERLHSYVAVFQTALVPPLYPP